MRTIIGSRYGLLVAIVLFFSVAFLVPSNVRADQTSALADLTSARLKLADCYAAAIAAEAASANISQLTISLNNAGLLLSRAELAYSNGDFYGTQSLAAQSQGELLNFVAAANSLQVAAAHRREQDFLWNFLGSIVGSVAVLVSSVTLWVLLKRKYGNGGSMTA